MNKYQQGKIYTLRCKTNNNLVYVGSTVNTLYKRWGSHVSECRKQHPSQIYQLMNENGGHENWYIELLQDYPCNNVFELRKREGEKIRELGTANSIIAGRTRKEYVKDNADYIKKQRQEYNIKNKERIFEVRKQYREQHHDKIAEKKREWDLNNKERKAYHDKKYKNGIHREEILEQKKQQYKKMIETETPEQKRERLDKANARRRELRRLKKEQQQKTD